MISNIKKNIIIV